MMTTSFSFSWQTPMTLNGVLTGYQLSCQPLLSSIPLPQPLNTTAVMATLSSLYPGVGYNCSIVARNSAGPSDPVYIGGSTQEAGTYRYAHVHILLCTTDLQVLWPSTSHQRMHSYLSMSAFLFLVKKSRATFVEPCSVAYLPTRVQFSVM